MPNLFSTPPAVVSDTRQGWDRTLVYADGRVRSLPNFYLPIPIDDPNKGYLEKTYQVGTALDPYWNAGYSAGTVQIVSDEKRGADRVATYTDGSTYVSVGWYDRNPAYSGATYNPAPPAPIPAPLAPLQDVPIGFPEDASQLPAMPGYIAPSNIVPSDVTLPLNLSAPAYPIAKLDVTPEVAAMPFQGPIQEGYTPGVPSLSTGIGNLTPGVPNTPSNNGAQGPAGLNVAIFGKDGWGGPGLIIAAIALYYILK